MFCGFLCGHFLLSLVGSGRLGSYVLSTLRACLDVLCKEPFWSRKLLRMFLSTEMLPNSNFRFAYTTSHAFFYLQNEHFMSLLIASTQNLYGILHFFYITYIRQHTYIYIYINCTYSFCAIYIIYSVPQKEHRKVFFRMLRPERRQENLDPTS